MVGLRRVVVVVVVLLVDEKDGSSKTTNLGRTCKTVNTSRHPKTQGNRLFLRESVVPVRSIRVPVPVPSAATVGVGVVLVLVVVVKAAILLKLQRRLVTMSNRCIGMIPTVIVN